MQQEKKIIHDGERLLRRMKKVILLYVSYPPYFSLLSALSLFLFLSLSLPPSLCGCLSLIPFSPFLSLCLSLHICLHKIPSVYLSASLSFHNLSCSITTYHMVDWFVISYHIISLHIISIQFIEKRKNIISIIYTTSYEMR